MRHIKLIFQKRLFLVILIIFIGFSLITQVEGINRTVNWSWIDDAIFYSPIIYIYFFYLFFIIYGVLTLLKKQTNLLYSIIHCILIIISAIFYENYNSEILLLFDFLSLFLFTANVSWSLWNKRSNIVTSA